MTAPAPSTPPARINSPRAGRTRSWSGAIALGAALATLSAAALTYTASASPGDSESAVLSAATASTSPTTDPTASPTGSPTTEPTPGPVVPTTPWAPTQVRVSTFNLLGYGHTQPGKRKGWLDGRARQKRANQIIRANALEIIGFQEMEQPQIDVFNAELGTTYDLWPGNTYTGKAKVNVKGNSIAWRRDQWFAVSTSYYDAPYFKGVNVPRPTVLLQHLKTGQQIYVSNTHNPANSFGDASKYRAQNVAIQAKTFNALRKANPTIPIIFTGDMNDRTTFFCSITGATSLRAVNGGTRTASTCTLPKAPFIDWILSTPDVQWTGYQQVKTAYVKKTTDHPVIWADATIQPPAAAQAGLKQAVVIDVEGLPSAAISGSRTSSAPHLSRLRTEGASTLNARTASEVVGSLPNLASILSGRPVAKSANGHGVTFSSDQPTKASYATFTKATGKYIRTLFDVVHDQGGSTSFMSSDANAAIVIRSATSGATDTHGVNYGANKLSVSSVRKTDAEAISVLQTQIRIKPRKISYLQLTGPRKAGEKYGYFSAKYGAAVRKVDAQIGAIRAAISANPATAGSTALIVTSSSGGAGTKSVGKQLTQHQIPFIVWGAGVAAGDLYAMNPTMVDPGAGRPGYTRPQPWRNSNVANVVTTLLGYPRLATGSAYTGAVNLLAPADTVAGQ